MATYAIKWDEKILVTPENVNSLVWYTFRELTESELIDYEKQELEKNGYIVEIVDWVCEKTSTEDSNKYEIKVKLDRMQEIRAEIVIQWFTADLPTDSRIDWKLLIYKQQLLDEYDELQLYVDETFESNLIDDVISSFFPSLTP